MSIDLSKYSQDLSAAHRDVLDDKTSTNWALFGYEGQTNTLKFVNKGSNGIEEMIEDLNSGKIMYAFVKVNDPKTSLDKFVLINWQGEGANTLRKGMCANHLRDVERFFTGTHLTINARNEEEVEPPLIIDKVSKSGSSYSFKSIKIENVEPMGPIGTTYQRVNPIKEINSRERDQFWRKEEAEEKKRIEEESKRREIERLKREEELKQRELEESAKREAATLRRDSLIDQVKQAEKLAERNIQSQQTEYVDVQNPMPTINQSEMLRKQRKQEAEDLIAQRTIDARSIFEKNTVVGQTVKKVPEKPVRNSILKAQQQQQQSQMNAEHKKETITVNKLVEEQSDDESDQFSTIKRSPKDVEKKPSTPVTSPSSETVNMSETNKQTTEEEPIVEQITDQQFVDEYLYSFSTPGLQARALYDYQAVDDTEITFDPGDIITNIDQVDEGWWQGLAPNGTYGLFPANYVELIK